MSLIEIKKARDYKTVRIFGLEFKIPRKDYKETFRPFKSLKPVIELNNDGFSLMTYSDSVAGDSVAVRYFINALEKAGIIYERLPLKGDILPKYKNKITFSNAPHYKPKEYNNISVFYWEFEDGMPEFFPSAFDGIKAVICFSSFNEEYFKKIAPGNVKIYKLPFIPCIERENLLPKKEIREKFGIPADSFVAYFNFSYNSSYGRKNPEAIVRAFAKAFPNDEKTCLVFKTVGSGCNANNKYKAALQDCIQKNGLSQKTIIIEESLSDNENHSLINACDVYISLHRGEGIGLGMLEAMIMGKPVIATAYGGNTDFIQKGHSFPVPYTMIAPKFNDIPDYAAVSKAAEPDADESAKILRNLYGDENLREETGKKALEFTKYYCSIEKYKEIMPLILKEL